MYNLHAIINPTTFDNVPSKIWGFATLVAPPPLLATVPLSAPLSFAPPSSRA